MGDLENDDRQDNDKDDGESQTLDEQFSQVVGNLKQLHSAFSTQSHDKNNTLQLSFDAMKAGPSFTDENKKKKGKKLLGKIREDLAQTSSISLKLKLDKTSGSNPNTEKNEVGEASIGPGIVAIKNMLQDLKSMPEDQALVVLEQTLDRTEKLKATAERVLQQHNFDKYSEMQSKKIKEEEKKLEEKDKHSYMLYTTEPNAFDNVLEPNATLEDDKQSALSPNAVDDAQQNISSSGEEKKLNHKKSWLQPALPKFTPPGRER